MRILHIGYRLPPEPGGMELHVERLIRAQVLRGREVIVAHRRGELPRGAEPMPVARTRASRAVSLKFDEIAFAMECAEALPRVPAPDVIHLHGDHREALALGSAARRLGIPLMLHIHGALTMRHRPIMPWAFRHVGGFIVAGTRPKADLHAIGVPDRLIRMTSAGLDVGRLTGFRDSGRVERGLIVSVGSLVKVKNHELTIEAFHRVRAVRPDARLVIAGDGPERDRLRRLAATGPGIEFTGHLSPDRIYSLVNRAEVLVHASQRLRGIGEGIPNAALEALALGTAVLVSSEATLDPVVPRDAYRTFRSGDASDLVARLHALLDDDEARRRLGERGVRAAEDLDWPLVAARIERWYEMVTTPRMPVLAAR
ncbi:glycosyltransferase family 4 protein [Microtetraspora fusca]|uniref:glycosyltransferase family 4 protein n=1 Tax=Microtetraspora fusca TaxID=1997 RepID=UPI00083201AA|nr:glycosyltransferase family 4 protein [Microtetraspora fusca]